MSQNPIKGEGGTYRIVVVVCHPDDEALWVGGLINALSKFPRIEVSVICLSGKDELSSRELEFLRAKELARYSHGVVLGGPLRAANDPLPDIPATVGIGLRLLGIVADEISLLLTHSPYGEEHMHPHHRQAFNELSAWAVQCKIPFGYFSCLPMPLGKLQPLLVSMRRSGEFQVINFAKCTYPLIDRVSAFFRKGGEILPKYYLQFLVDMTAKRSMLNCYQSIGIEKHEAGYAMFTSNCESIYLNDENSLKAFTYAMSEMSVPGCENLFFNLEGGGRMRRVARNLLARIP